MPYGSNTAVKVGTGAQECNSARVIPNLEGYQSTYLPYLSMLKVYR